MTTMNKLENGRADFAYKAAEKGSKLDKKARKEYKAYVKKIPMFIKTNGLGATFAFIFSKKKNGNAYSHIYKQVSEWFKQEDNPFKFEFSDFTEKLCEMDSQQYRAITTETLALFSWLRRFAEGLIEGD